MSALAIAVAAGSWVFSLIAVKRIQIVALRRGDLDVPNERSSHSSPVPTGGGLGIVVVVLVGVLVLWLTGNAPVQIAAAIAGGSLVAAVGMADDRSPLTPGVRLVVHFATAIWATFWIGGLAPVQIGSEHYDLGALGDGLAVIGIVWGLNLFNFMDGIDGIAGSEGTFVAGSGALLAFLLGTGTDIALIGALTAGSCIGFLSWNWPPARIFMGDVGSGFLGFVLSVLALAASHTHPTVMFSWLILGGVFLADATVTLMRRLVRGEKVYKAHRSHAYQHLARRLNSHRLVTIGVICINLAWCLPLAIFAAFFPRHAPMVVTFALVPLFIGVVLAKGGQPERE